VTSIGPDAFEYCTSLTRVNISSGVMCIGRGAFHGCSGLKSLKLPQQFEKERMKIS
jgi:hypothetical protein